MFSKILKALNQICLFKRVVSFENSFFKIGSHFEHDLKMLFLAKSLICSQNPVNFRTPEVLF
jgi:hypothetical protein